MLQMLAVIALFVAGVIVGTRSGRRRRWWLPFSTALLILTVVIAGHRSMGLSVVAPFSWAIAPDMSPLLMALIIPVMLSTLIVKLPNARKRAAVAALMLFMFAFYSLLPILSPLATRASLLAGRTIIDPHGICLQTHPYTCGPAAAVTCLHALGIPAYESEIAIAARTGPLVGTDPILLQNAINTLYAPAAIHCGYRITRNLDEVKPPFIATMWIPHIGGHYVAVLQVTPDSLIVGDPLTGRSKWSRSEFEQDWKGAAHELSRVPPPP